MRNSLARVGFIATFLNFKKVESCSFFKPLEFEGFKTGIVQVLPDSQELDRVAVLRDDQLTAPFGELTSMLFLA